jgi:hypothetical protein
LRRNTPPPVAIPAYARAQLRRSTTLALALACFGVTSALAASVAGAERQSWDSHTSSLITIAAFALLACLIASARMVPAWRCDRRGFERQHAPDLIDDLRALLAPSGSSRLRALRRTLAGLLDRVGEGRFGIRRHPRAWAGGLAFAAAIAFDGWHIVREGPWANVRALLIYGALAGSSVLVLAVLSSWLMLVRPLKSSRDQSYKKLESADPCVPGLGRKPRISSRQLSRKAS